MSTALHRGIGHRSSNKLWRSNSIFLLHIFDTEKKNWIAMRGLGAFLRSVSLVSLQLHLNNIKDDMIKGMQQKC